MLKRSDYNPILKPNPENSWESRKVYNSGVVRVRGKYHLFYRAVGDDWISHIGHAVSKDGEKFTRKHKPLLSPTLEFEKKGVEDARLTILEDEYFLTYTGFDGKTARLELATSIDLKNWKKHGPLFLDWNFLENKNFIVEWDAALNNIEEDVNWSKAGGIFPEKINGKYYMLFGDRNIWMATSDDKYRWTPDNEPFLTPQKLPAHGLDEDVIILEEGFDSAHIEMGPPPIKTEKGWLVLYHGINKKIEYKIGFVLLDLKDPTKILYRTTEPIFEPKEPYEINGLVDILPGGFETMRKMNKEELKNFIKENKELKYMPKVIFCCGAVVVSDNIEIFYGASDSVICKATASLKEILKVVK